MPNWQGSGGVRLHLMGAPEIPVSVNGDGHVAPYHSVNNENEAPLSKVKVILLLDTVPTTLSSD